jgi:acyl carrier protein phosphodiesterase
MAAIAFDPLEYTHQLEASGVPREQAEVHAKTMTTMFLHNLDALVTRDYLDSRFNEFEARIESSIDKRFDGVDQRFGEVGQRFVGVDKRFAEMDRRFDGMDKRFAEMDQRFDAVDKRFAEMDQRFDAVDKRFAEMGQRFDGMDKRFAEMDQRFDAVDKRFVEVDQRFNAMEIRFVELESSINVRFERVDGKLRLLFWMQALTIACVVLPVIRELLG